MVDNFAPQILDKANPNQSLFFTHKAILLNKMYV